MPGSSPLEFAGRPAHQQDATSCGAAALVVARAAADGAYAQWLDAAPTRFREQQARVRRRTLARGLGPAPWPSGLGTPPWTAARELQSIVGRPVEEVVIGPGDYRNGRVLKVLRTAVLVTTSQLPVVLYTGHELFARHAFGTSLPARAALHVLPFLPRHVVVALPGAGARLRIYEPGSATVTEISPEAIVAVGDAAPAPGRPLEEAHARARRAMGGWSRVCRVLLPSLA